jgi:hypothetical protein
MPVAKQQIHNTTLEKPVSGVLFAGHVYSYMMQQKNNFGEVFFMWSLLRLYNKEQL